MLSYSGNLLSQEKAEEFDKVYGLDQLLYNGIKYTYFLPSGTGGNQYLISPDYIKGDLTIREKTFNDVMLNYDIYNQQLLLQYVTGTGALNVLEVSKAWLSSFKLGNMHFEYLDAGKESRFYQLLGDGPVRILYYWHKSLKLDMAYGTTNYTFSPAVKETFILLNDKIIPFGNKRGLLNIFEGEKRDKLKTYLSKYRIKLKKASDHMIAVLANYVSEL